MKNISLTSFLLVLLSLFISKAEAQSKLVSFGPALSYIRVGAQIIPTFPIPLTVTLDSPSQTDVFIAISNSDPNSLSVTGGGVTILAGTLSAQVLVTGLVQNSSVQLTASLSTQQLSANVRVVGDSETPQLASIDPSTNTIQPGETHTLSTSLDIPAGNGGVTVNLSVEPSNAGRIPATVFIPENQTTAEFTYTDSNAVSSAKITGQFETYTVSATIDWGTVTSLNPTTLESGNSIFPNPFSNQITIVASDNEQSTISLYNIYSQLISTEVFSKSININTIGLPSGIYIYKLKTGNSKILKGKIVKE